jgi:type IV secretory pathway VirB10-like protein
MINRWLAAAALALAAQGAGADGVYKWTDAQGRVHFGDRPPDDAATTAIAPPAPPAVPAPTDAERAARQQRLLDMYRDERLEKEEREAKKKTDEEERRRRCAHARDRLNRYEHSPRIYDPQPNGERRYLSDGERDAEIRIARNEVARLCKPSDNR